MKTCKILLLIVIPFLSSISIKAQKAPLLENNRLQFRLNDDGSRYIRITGLAQIWLRNTQFNSGTTINGYEKSGYTDISIRRLRFHVTAQLTEKVFFYSQFGQNNFNFSSEKFTGAFFHDAVVEFAFHPSKLSVGGGLTAWNGLMRYASPSIGTILSLDAPLYQQATNSVNDQFLRKLSIYAKGQLGKLDYRLILSQPMTITGAPTGLPSLPTSTDYSFSNEPAKKQLQGYFKYMFRDIESNLMPYEPGTYLGRKDVFNVGAGFIYQPDAMWALDNGNIDRRAMLLYGVDIFYDHPIDEDRSVTLYGSFSNYNFGQGYIRNVGVNNAGTGASGPSVGGAGGAFPMIGNGPTLYAQAGYLFGHDILTRSGKLQPFAALQYSSYDYLEDPMAMFEVGGNYLIHGTHNSKISVMYQSRPTYTSEGGENVLEGRKGMTVLQYQIAF